MLGNSSNCPKQRPHLGNLPQFCGGGGTMADSDPTEFVCPGCGSGYKVVRLKADADLPHRLIHCRVCKQPLAAIDGEFVAKYFLLRRGKAKRQKAPQGSGA